LKQRLDGSLSGSFSSASSSSSSENSNGAGKSWCAMLPSVKDGYLYVDVNDPHSPVSDRDDSSLGEGAFGEVFLAKGKFNGELVAIKMLKLKKVKSHGVSIDTMRQEAASLRRLTHINIVRIWSECQEEDGKLYGIVMEYAPGGSVQGRLKYAAGKGLPQARQWLLELGQGLCHMHHECRMQHRDLKPHNLLLDGQDRLKISDLGLACAYQTAQSLSKQGTGLYMSPEKGSGKKYGTMDDMWAVGCILLELLRGAEMATLCPAGLSFANEGFIQGLVAPLQEETSGCFAGAVDLVLRLLQVL
jgi:serine/threonine protein kinase